MRSNPSSPPYSPAAEHPSSSSAAAAEHPSSSSAAAAEHPSSSAAAAAEHPSSSAAAAAEHPSSSAAAAAYNYTSPPSSPAAAHSAAAGLNSPPPTLRNPYSPPPGVPKRRENSSDPLVYRRPRPNPAHPWSAWNPYEMPAPFYPNEMPAPQPNQVDINAIFAAFLAANHLLPFAANDPFFPPTREPSDSGLSSSPSTPRSDNGRGR